MSGVKLFELDDAAAMVRSGMSVGIGGILGRRRPIALCRAVARTGARRLHVYSFLSGQETEVLAGAGAVQALTTGYVDPTAGAAAVEEGLARGAIALHECSEHLFVGGLMAAGSGLPFWPTLGAVGSDVSAGLGLRTVTCPYTGRPVIAVPATPLDVALLHAEAATRAGDVLAPGRREFLDDADLALARAAARVIVTVDRLATSDEVAGGHLAVLAPFEVHAVVLLEPEVVQ
jgi:glutaconate CoA-transferase subunit A